jgi:xyloglucan-specific exo-beta-1,4-glucanase
MKRYISSVGLAVVLAALAVPAAAQPNLQNYLWRNVTVGGGGFIPGIVFSRLEKGLVYLRSDIGGDYRWDNALGQWVPLLDALAESSYQGGESIAPDPVDADVVYVAGGMYRTDPAAMLRSADRGRTWEVYPVRFAMGGNEDGRGCGERLAVDPNDNRILYFGSRHDGLMRSDDKARTWRQVESFPLKGTGLAPGERPPGAGLSFVVFNPASGSRGSATPTIFVGSTDPGPQHLFRSDDAGKTWNAVSGAPADLLPLKAEIDDRHILFIAWSDDVGPNGVKKGAVSRLDTKSNIWTDITPDRGPRRLQGGYCGISLDRQNPGTLAVSTLDHWGPVDTVYRSVDDGKSWAEISQKSVRDVSASPFLLWGKPEAKLGWWITALAIDPFDSNHAVYATGATVYATEDFSRVSADQPTHWFAWVRGIEQTAIITLLSPASGAPLLSGFGDIGGFVHTLLDVSPPQMYSHPRFDTTVTLECAALDPRIIVRGGNPADAEPRYGWSEDGGLTWSPLPVPSRNRNSRESAPIAISADGQAILLMTAPPRRTVDRGQSWREVGGLPLGARPVADRVDPLMFYAVSSVDGATAFFASQDAGQTFHKLNVTGLPADVRGDLPSWREAAWPLASTPGKEGDLWFISKSGLYHRAGGGAPFARVDSDLHVEMLSFGKAPAGSDYPALFAIGTLGDRRAVWRTDDVGRTWLLLNDDQHQWGRRFRCISGDPRVFGRVYIGTDGRGVLYGQPANTQE